MASHMDAPRETSDSNPDRTSTCQDRIDAHLQSALDAAADEQARYHLREALQLQLAELHGES